MNKIILAAGCFWGVQEIFDSTPGVTKTEAGYTGGHIENPTYEMICSGTTNHAEAVEIQFLVLRLVFLTRIFLIFQFLYVTQ